MPVPAKLGLSQISIFKEVQYKNSVNSILKKTPCLAKLFCWQFHNLLQTERAATRGTSDFRQFSVAAVFKWTLIRFGSLVYCSLLDIALKWKKIVGFFCVCVCRRVSNFISFKKESIGHAGINNDKFGRLSCLINSEKRALWLLKLWILMHSVCMNRHLPANRCVYLAFHVLCWKWRKFFFQQPATKDKVFCRWTGFAMSHHDLIARTLTGT